MLAEDLLVLHRSYPRPNEWVVAHSRVPLLLQEWVVVLLLHVERVAHNQVLLLVHQRMIVAVPLMEHASPFHRLGVWKDIDTLELPPLYTVGDDVQQRKRELLL